MSYPHPDEGTRAYNSPTMPRRNVDWVEVIVKWTRYDYVAMYDYPTTEGSDTLMPIYKGDMIFVSRKYRRQDWCLCQVGHMLGWVFLKDVKFMRQQGVGSAPRPIPADLRQRQPKQEIIETQEAAITESLIQQIDEDDTAPPMQQPLPMPQLNTEPEFERRATQIQPVSAEKKPLIQRLINFFKR